MKSLVAGILFLVSFLTPTMAQDVPWWEEEGMKEWFKNEVVKQCCDNRDAYLADDFHDDGKGNWVAVITDGSPNPEYRKPEIPNGTKIIVPQTAFRVQPRVPSGHGVIFLKLQWNFAPDGGPGSYSPRTDDPVYCYFAPGGV